MACVEAERSSRAVSDSSRGGGSKCGFHDPTGSDVNKQLLLAVKLVADRLGNTAAVCRKSYIHPAVIDAWVTRGGDDLDADEIATLDFLRKNPSGEDEIRVLRRKVLKSIAAAREKKAL
jgi:DNA topoisomerase IB